MELTAIYHRPESEYAYLYKDGQLHIRIRTKKEDIKRIVLHYGDPFIFIEDLYEATKEIRKLSEVIPIIAVTAYAFASDEEQVMNSGFDAYASKPLNASALKKQMVDLLRARVFVI